MHAKGSNSRLQVNTKEGPRGSKGPLAIQRIVSRRSFPGRHAAADLIPSHMTGLSQLEAVCLAFRIAFGRRVHHEQNKND